MGGRNGTGSEGNTSSGTGKDGAVLRRRGARVGLSDSGSAALGGATDSAWHHMLLSWLDFYTLKSIVNNFSLGSDGRNRKHWGRGLGEDRAWTAEWRLVIAATHKELGLGAALGIEDAIVRIISRGV